MNRRILHIDLDAFFCSVEELKNPDLRGKPFAVGGHPDRRGVVTSCSYAARQFGIHSAMPMSRAVYQCPGLLIIQSRYKDYSHYSKKVIEILTEVTQQVEQVSIDEAYLDVSSLTEPAIDIARSVQKEINDRINLPCSIGVAANKLLAKIANDIGKSSVKDSNPPNAITTVPPGKEAAFLAPLPVEYLWGVGPKTAEKMASHGIHTIGDIANLPEIEVIGLFGKNGIILSHRSCGIDNRPIITYHEAKSISHETTFSIDVIDREQLEETLIYLSSKVGKRLRSSRKYANIIKIKVRWQDFTTITKQTTLNRPTDQDDQISSIAIYLFSKVWHNKQPIRLVGIGVSGFRSNFHQLSLWGEMKNADKNNDERLISALDNIRRRFGSDMLRIGWDQKKI